MISSFVCGSIVTSRNILDGSSQNWGSTSKSVPVAPKSNVDLLCGLDDLIGSGESNAPSMLQQPMQKTVASDPPLSASDLIPNISKNSLQESNLLDASINSSSMGSSVIPVTSVNCEFKCSIFYPNMLYQFQVLSTLISCNIATRLNTAVQQLIATPAFYIIMLSDVM